MEHPIRRYLEDAIAAEKNFESQLKDFAEDASLPQAGSLFDQHALETKRQHDLLTQRLEELGGRTSILKTLLPNLFGGAPKLAQLGHEDDERSTQNLMMAFAIENAEIAMYECLTIAAETAGDEVTADLARRIQMEERAAAQNVWNLIAPAARQGFRSAASTEETGAQAVLLSYLEDAEAAERSCSDILIDFSEAGEQKDVQTLMALLSDKSRSQHRRIEARLERLGGSASTGKSFLAHVLSFGPLTAQLGHSDSERSTQHLMISFASAAAQMAMYEALATAAGEAGDAETLALARELQAEEEDHHRTVWQKISPSARHSLQAALSHSA